MTALLLIALIVEHAASERYPIQEAAYLPTTLVDGVTQIGTAVIPSPPSRSVRIAGIEGKQFDY